MRDGGMSDSQQGLSRPEDALYEELTRLNNELVTAQRALSQRNADLLALAADLESRVAERTRHLEGLATRLVEAGPPLPERQKGWVEMMRAASCRQAALIEDILGYLQL